METIVELSAREHLLKLPGMYIGSMTEISTEEMILENNKFSRHQVAYVPALLKIINEALDNSLDEAIKTNFAFGNRIEVSMTDSLVSIKDNGRGIPVVKSKATNEYMPVMAFCNARAGSNFDKKEGSEFSIGTHGIGIKATNIFSKKFDAETSDGHNKLKLSCRDNLSSSDFTISKSSSNYTKIKFEPDLEKFGLDKIDEVYRTLIYQRILFLSFSYPKIKFYFNGSRVRLSNTKQFLSLFSESFEIFENDDWFVGVYPSDDEEFSFFSYVDGLYLKRGGNQVEVFASEFSYKLRDILSKKYKTIKPGDVRNKLSLVVFFKDFPSMQFDSQTKETLTNSVAEVRQYLGLSSEDFINMAKVLSKNEAIVEPIIEMFKLKEELKKRRSLKEASTKKKRVVSDAYYTPIGEKKYLMLTEGFSATSSMLKSLGRKNIAYYSLRGKPLNTYNITAAKMVKNKEFGEIIRILGLDLLDKNTDMEYENVIMLTDSDSDGIHIRSLLLAFFNKYAPKMVKDGRIKMMNTPLLISFDKKSRPVKWFFTIDEYNEAVENDSSLLKLRTEYYKGLGTFNKATLTSIIKKVGSMEDFFVQFVKTENSDTSIKEWLSNSESDSRKLFLKDRKFSLSSV